MSSTDILTIQETGRLTLPDDITERYQFKQEKKFRIIETQKGVLLIPLTDEPMNDDLIAELSEWQAIGSESWEMFEFEENAIKQKFSGERAAESCSARNITLKT